MAAMSVSYPGGKKNNLTFQTDSKLCHSFLKQFLLSFSTAHAEIITKSLYLNILSHRTRNKVHSGRNLYQNSGQLTG